MTTDLTICPNCKQAALEWKDEEETTICCPVCGAEWIELKDDEVIYKP